MKALSHVAIIMDGNGRWAQKKNKSRSYGHKHGVKNIEKIVKCCVDENIKYLTLYVFSKDNWKRSKKEIFFLFNLLENYLKKNLNFLIKNNIKLKFIGERKKLKKQLLTNIKKVEKKTSKLNTLTLFLAFNYSAKSEICSAIKKIILNKGKISPISITNNLFTANAPDPEILIRTGGYSRLSDFMLWQISYSEIFFVKKLWPDFKKKDFLNIIFMFKKIKRNFGSVDE